MIKPESNMCFVLMPFNIDFKNQWELAIFPAIRESGLAPWRGDDEHLGTNIIMRDITKCIADSKLIVADLTGRNPNVMYELGLAHSAKKPVIMIAQKDEDVPFDIRHIRYLRYDTRDLSKLRAELIDRIKSTLLMDSKDRPDFFPELKLFNHNEARELAYLRQRARRLIISAVPYNTDIFFNDNNIGRPPQEIYVNPDSPRNTISASAIGFYEYHADISPQDIDRGEITVDLEIRGDKEEFEKRVPRWLRYRRRDPNNPVLMRAISQYLDSISDEDEAIQEAEELLKVAPDWFMAQNQAGYVKMKNYPEEAKRHFEKVVALSPDHYVGYYNLACSYALEGDLQRSIDYIEQIASREELIRSFQATRDRIESDSDFCNLNIDPQYSSRFHELAQLISNKPI